jgi:hypothetical protein
VEAVVLDLVQPVGSGGQAIDGVGAHGRMKPSGGFRRQRGAGGCGATLDEHTAYPKNVLRSLIESFDRLGAIERIYAEAGDVETLKLVAQCRRQRALTAKLIWQRASDFQSRIDLLMSKSPALGRRITC